MPIEQESLTPARLIALLSRYRKLLIVPAIVGAVLAALGTFVSPRDWKAEQGLLIRSDAAGYADQRLGKFTDLSEMKTVQETLLELARSHSVVAAVLSEVDGHEPSAQDVADFRDKLRLTPPGGAEFGKTEVFYIGVLNPSKQRAIAYVETLTRTLDERLAELRGRRAASMVDEVQRSVGVARGLLHTHVESLSSFEQSIGADLMELRYLVSPNGGTSALGQESLAIEAELRQSGDQQREYEALLVELRNALADPSTLLATPDSLLRSQPGLSRLKDGLVDAQLSVARASGVRTANHPRVLAARRAQEAVHTELLRELPSAIAGVEIELRIESTRAGDLAAKLDEINLRSANLAGMRSHYSELTANVEGQTSVLEGALKQLADAQAHLAGVKTASVLAAIDGVDTGVRPVGPGRSSVTLAGGMAGLLLGGVLVFVLYGPKGSPTGAAVQTKQPIGSFGSESPAPSLWEVELARAVRPSRVRAQATGATATTGRSTVVGV